MMNDESAVCRLLPGVCRLLTAVLVAIAALPVRAQTSVVVPVEGGPFEAALSAIDSDWQVTFGFGDERRVLPATELVRWGVWGEPGRGPVLVLADGGRLVADVFEADKERLAADSGLFGLVEIPLELVAGVAFRLPANRQRRERLFDRIASAAGDRDLVILANGDEVTGRVEAIREDAIKLETAVGPVDVVIDRALALAFNPALLHREKRKGLHAAAGFSDGSRLVSDRLVLGEESLSIDTADGLRWNTDGDALVAIQPLGGGVTYLSDLKANDDRHVPFLELDWPYRTDRNVSGGLLRSGGRLYLKGLGVHSAARLTYLLTKPYRRFEAEFGIDDCTSGGGSVRFRVFVDGQLRHTSDTIRGGTVPAPVSVDLSGAKRLDLVVDFADRADEQDHANWLDARLVE